MQRRNRSPSLMVVLVVGCALICAPAFSGEVTEEPVRNLEQTARHYQAKTASGVAVQASFSSGAYCDGGAWVNGSSRSYKENINDLSSEEALDTLADLQPTSFNYKTDSEETYLGFIAEDVPDLVATKDRKGLVAMDIVAVLTKVVQTQQEQIRALEESIEALQTDPIN